MLRAALAVLVCLALGGCWVSEQRMFGQADFARIAFAGRYTVSTPGDPTTSAEVSVRDGTVLVIKRRETDGGDLSSEEADIAFVAIPGGSGDYFVGIDQTNPADGESYVIARFDGRTIDFYMPDCDGTAPRSGMTKKTGVATFCTFTTREAVLGAALEAEGFIDSPHVIATIPAMVLAPADDG